MIKIDMISIKGGTFQFGDKLTVTVSDFKIGEYPVTQAQWRAVMGNNPSYFKDCDDCPVEQVSWDDVQDFIAKLNQQTGLRYRLPTEAEWEYAARGGAKSKDYLYAGSNNLEEVGWYYKNSGLKTQPVGLKKANELGLYDMSGNVWEWCADWYGDYPQNPKVNPKGPEKGKLRVLRGGCWYDYDVSCRSAGRGRGNPDGRSNVVGFRIAI